MTYHFLNANEQVLMEGGANKTIFLGFNKGGMLIFKATFSSKIEEIPLASILTSGDSFNLLIPTGNMIRVCTRDGKTHQFLVVGKQKEDWKRALTNVVYALRS